MPHTSRVIVLQPVLEIYACRLEVVDDNGWASFGHDPSPLAERHDDVVRLTVDAEQDDSPVIELSVTELRRLLAGAERDLIDFLHLAAAWTSVHLPDRAASVTSALGRALELPAPVIPPNPWDYVPARHLGIHRQRSRA